MEAAYAIQEYSEIDFARYHIEAGLLFARGGDMEHARQCLDVAEPWRATFAKYAIGEEIIASLDELKEALSE